MRVMTLADAKARFSAVLDDVVGGESVVITRRGVPIARIVAERAPKRRSATSWVMGLRAFVDAQPMSDEGSVAAMRSAERY